jgi:hypothetical protein
MTRARKKQNQSMNATPIETNRTAPVDARTEAFQGHISEVRYRRPAYGHAGMLRPRAHGKFLFVGDEKFWIRGVT